MKETYFFEHWKGKVSYNISRQYRGNQRNQIKNKYIKHRHTLGDINFISRFHLFAFRSIRDGCLLPYSVTLSIDSHTSFTLFRNSRNLEQCPTSWHRQTCLDTKNSRHSLNKCQIFRNWNLAYSLDPLAVTEGWYQYKKTKTSIPITLQSKARASCTVQRITLVPTFRRPGHAFFKRNCTNHEYIYQTLVVFFKTS